MADHIHVYEADGGTLVVDLTHDFVCFLRAGQDRMAMVDMMMPPLVVGQLREALVNWEVRIATNAKDRREAAMQAISNECQTQVAAPTVAGCDRACGRGCPAGGNGCGGDR